MLGARNLSIIKKMFIMILLNIVLYLIFAFFAEKYNLIYATGYTVDFVLQSDYRYLWQAFLWSIFALFMGSIYGYSIRNQQQKVKCFFITLIFGLIVMISVDIFFESLFPNGSVGFLIWHTDFDGKINLTFLSVVMWPFAYLISFILVSQLGRKRTG